MSNVTRLQPDREPTNLGKVTYLGSRPKELPLGTFEPHEECPCWSCRHARRRASVTTRSRFWAAYAACVIVVVALAYAATVGP